MEHLENLINRPVQTLRGVGEEISRGFRLAAKHLRDCERRELLAISDPVAVDLGLRLNSSHISRREAEQLRAKMKYRRRAIMEAADPQKLIEDEHERIPFLHQ